MGGAIGLWVAAEWRRRWRALVGVALLVALAGGAATALAAGARRADTAYSRFREATGEPNLAAQVELGGTGRDLRRRGRGAVRRPRRGARRARRPRGRAVGRGRVVVGDRPLPGDGCPRRGDGVRHGHVRQGGRARHAVVIDGQLPDVDDPDAVTINEEAVRAMGLAVGDTLTFETASPRTAPRVGGQRRPVRLARGARRADDRGPGGRRHADRRGLRGAVPDHRLPRGVRPCAPRRDRPSSSRSSTSVSTLTTSTPSPPTSRRSWRRTDST